MDDTDRKYMWFSEISRTDIKWLWYPYIPYGKITVLQGDPGCGKSMMMVSLISRLTTGRPLPGLSDSTEPINVIYQCSEDGLCDTVIPRLEAARADCTRVACINEDLYTVTLDDEILKQAIIDLNAKLLVIDPFQAYLGESDLSNLIGMRKVLKRLGAWASKFNCAVVLVGHLNKRSGQKELYRGLGSVDIMALARSVMQLEKYEEDTRYRTLRHVKASLTGLAGDLHFVISEGGDLDWSCGENAGVTNTDSNADFLWDDDSISGEKSELAAKMMIQALLNGQLPAKPLIESIRKMNVGERTIKNVKMALNIESVRKNGIWYWKLPDTERQKTE